MDIVFVNVRNPYTKNESSPLGDRYHSYWDFWRIVELSEFKICEFSEVNPQSQTIYIIPHNDRVPDWFFDTPRTAKFILWQVERYNLVDTRYDEIWFYDKTIHDLVVYPKAKYVFFGGDSRLMRVIDTPKIYDFFHMMHAHGRRQIMADDLERRGFTLAPCPYDYEPKNLSMQQSRVGLCLHQDEMHFIEPFRYTVFSCYKLPLLCEPGNATPFMTYSYEHFLRFNEPISHITNWQDNYDLVTNKMPFKQCVLNALKDYDFSNL